MLTKESLRQFHGTEQYYRHWLGYLYTDGVHHVAQEGGANWLLDAIFSYRRKEVFQIWELRVSSDKKAVLTMKEDSDKPFLVSQSFDYTDFPLESITFYLIDTVLLLPSEY